MIHLPTNGIIECDECGVEEAIDLTSYCGDPETVGFDGDLPHGWIAKESEHFCEQCAPKIQG